MYSYYIVFIYIYCIYIYIYCIYIYIYILYLYIYCIYIYISIVLILYILYTYTLDIFTCYSRYIYIIFIYIYMYIYIRIWVVSKRSSSSSEGAKGMLTQQLTRCLRTRSFCLRAGIAYADAYAGLRTPGFCLPRSLVPPKWIRGFWTWLIWSSPRQQWKNSWLVKRFWSNTDHVSGLIPTSTSKQRRFPANRLRPGTWQDPVPMMFPNLSHIGWLREITWDIKDHQTGPATKTNVDEIAAWLSHFPCQSCYSPCSDTLLKRHFKGSFCIGSQLVLASHQFHLVARTWHLGAWTRNLGMWHQKWLPQDWFIMDGSWWFMMLQCKNCVTSGPTARNNFVTTKLSATTAKTHVQYSNHLGMNHNTQDTVNFK